MPSWIRSLPVVGLQLCAALGAFALVLVAHGGWAGFAASFDPACAEPICDWQRHYVPTALALAESGLPTWGFVYPPTLAILIWPLAGTAVGTAVWVGLLALGQLGLAVIPPHLVPDTPPRLAVLLAALSGLAVATLEVVSWGQVSGLLVLLGMLALAPATRRLGLGGALLGLAVAVKVYPLLVVPALVARRRWLDLGTTLLVIALLGVGLPALVLGVDGTIAFYQAAVTEIVRLVPDFERSIGPQSFVSVVDRLVLGFNPVLRPVAGVLGVLLGLGQLGVLFVVRLRRTQADAWLWTFVLAYGAFPFFVASSWLHYFVHLPLMWLLLGRVILRERPTHRLGVMILTVSSIGLGTWPAWVGMGHAWYPALGAALASHSAALVGLLLVLFGGSESAQDNVGRSEVDTPEEAR